MTFGQAFDIVHRGFQTWRGKLHNAKWNRLLEGTPIPNDLTVCIAEELAATMVGYPPTAEAYEAACKALRHWRAEAARLGELAGEKPREMQI